MCLLMQTSTPRERERRDRGRATGRVFVNADKYKCLAIFNMAKVHTTL